MQITEYINKDTVMFLNETDKRSCISKLIKRAFELGKIKNMEAFTKAIEERESLISTGIGLGVAVPHAKLPDIPEFFIITAVNSKPVSWDSIDSEPVNLVFLIGGPADKQTEYLKLLSSIILIVKDDNKRGKLKAAGNIQNVTEQFS